MRYWLAHLPCAAQSLLVSGESGAGKTETNKQLMNYLIWRAGSHVSVGSNVSGRIQATNPVLEALGNAKSIRNNNSSRFGKYVNLKFSKEWKVIGAEVRTFLLEKSRVTNASLPKERSYHIFYQLLKGSQLDGKGEPELLGKQPEDFLYTRMSGTGFIDPSEIDDDENFREMDSALFDCGLDMAEKEQMYGVYGAMLYLGNVEFTSKADGSDSGTELLEVSLPSLRTAEKLLGISDISDLLVVKVILSPRPGSDKKYRLTIDKGAAANQRDALVRHLYYMLFNVLVDRINTRIAEEKTCHKYIGLLDVFGFEILQKNSFEQVSEAYSNPRVCPSWHQVALARR